MPTTSRARRGLRAFLLLTPALVLAACGGTSASTSEAGSPPTTAGSSSAPESSTPSSASRAPGQTVELTQYGVSYRVPEGWTSIDATKVIDAQNPVIRNLAGRLGVSPEQLIASFKKNLRAMSVSDRGAVGGVLDNINAIATPTAGINDDQIKLQLSALGAHPGRSATSPPPPAKLFGSPTAGPLRG